MTTILAATLNVLSLLYGTHHGGTMPPKIRQLKADLSKAGFLKRQAKGSHTYWIHPHLPGIAVTLSGKDGDDADKYQIKQVKEAVRKLGRPL